MIDTPKVLGGRYEVGALLGRGGMAEVHRGYDTRLSRQVAVKLLRLDLARDQALLTRFRREAQAAAGLSHRDIVAVYDSGENTVIDAGGAEVPLPYIVMELVEGQTLREKLNDHGKLEPGEAARVTMAVLDALAYSHSKGIIHRDIKPANVMVTKDGQVKVMDFGIARALADGAATMTQTSAVMGTAQYLSPEQAQGMPVDARSDLYSAGCMLFELLTGRPPFVGDSPVSIAYQHVGEPIPLPSRFNPLVPPALDTVVSRALVKDRDGRYQSAAEFRADLAAAREGRALGPAPAAAAAAVATEVTPVAAATAVVPTVPAPAGPPPVVTGPLPVPVYADPEPERRRRGGLWALLIALLLLAGAGIGYLAMSGKNDTPPPVTKAAVPQLVPLTRAAAEKALTDKGLKLEVAEQVFDDAAPVDTVMKQDPGAGAEVATGSSVRVTLSRGPSMTQLPDLRGKTKDQAVQALKDAGFTQPPTFGPPVDQPKVDKDKVVTQNPPAGSVKASSVVTLVLATGNVKVGNYVGKNIAVVYIALEQLGLGVKAVYVDSDKEPGTVLEQDRKDLAVPNGSTITFKVAQRPNPTVTSVTTVYTTPSNTSTTTTTTGGTTTTTPPPPGAQGGIPTPAGTDPPRLP